MSDRSFRIFPKHACYVEPFAEGAALFFVRPVPAEVEVLNDVNGDLVNLYRVVQHHLEEFVRQLKWALTSRQVVKWLQDTRPETLTDINVQPGSITCSTMPLAGRSQGSLLALQRPLRLV